MPSQPQGLNLPFCLIVFLPPSPHPSIHCTQKDHHHRSHPSRHGCLLDSPYHIAQASRPTDKIDTHFTPTNSTQSPPRQPSETPLGPLNHSVASHSNSSGSSFTATISPHDYPFFITDNQQIWLTQPPSPRPTTQNTSQTFSQTPQADFVLFPSPSPARPTRPSTELVQETLCTIPSNFLSSAPQGRLPQQQQHYRRNTTQQYPHSVSPFQNPRVRNSIQGPALNVSSTTSSQRSNSSSGQHKHSTFYASSAPSSTFALSSPPSSSTRPPVPLFSHNSTGTIHQASQKISTMGSPHGTFPIPSSSAAHCELICNHSDLNHEGFDFGSHDYLPADDSSPDYTLFNTHESEPIYESSMFEAINASSSAQVSVNTQTVSPKDIFMDPTSAPPSAATTYLSTPGTFSMESPFVTHSTDTSPMFADDLLDEGADTWGTLFPIDSAVHQSIEAVAPPMSRNQSSPGQSSSRGSHQGRHSSFSGINAKKRDKPLPPITIEDPSDLVAVKRARNTAAARKSRQKKMERVEELEAKIVQLEMERDHWKDMFLRGSNGHIQG